MPILAAWIFLPELLLVANDIMENSAYSDA